MCFYICQLAGRLFICLLMCLELCTVTVQYLEVVFIFLSFIQWTFTKYLLKVRAGRSTPSSNFTGEASKAQTCSRSHSQDEAELELEPQSSLASTVASSTFQVFPTTPSLWTVSYVLSWVLKAIGKLFMTLVKDGKKGFIQGLGVGEHYDECRDHCNGFLQRERDRTQL